MFCCFSTAMFPHCFLAAETTTARRERQSLLKSVIKEWFSSCNCCGIGQRNHNTVRQQLAVKTRWEEEPCWQKRNLGPSCSDEMSGETKAGKRGHLVLGKSTYSWAEGWLRARRAIPSCSILLEAFLRNKHCAQIQTAPVHQCFVCVPRKQTGFFATL